MASGKYYLSPFGVGCQKTLAVHKDSHGYLCIHWQGTKISKKTWFLANAGEGHVLYFLQIIVFVFVFCCACQCFQSSPWESLCPARVFSACLSKVAKFCNRIHHLKINYLLDSFSRKWISVLASHRSPDLETICLLVSLLLDGNMYQNPSIEKEFHIRIPRVRKEFSIRGLCFRRDSALESLIKKQSCPPEPVICNRTSYQNPLLQQAIFRQNYVLESLTLKRILYWNPSFSRDSPLESSFRKNSVVESLV